MAEIVTVWRLPMMTESAWSTWSRPAPNARSGNRLAGQPAVQDVVIVDARTLGQNTGGQLLRRHFQGEERHLLAFVLGPVGFAEIARGIEGHGCRKELLLPMLGRPARMSRSDGCKPPSLLSMSTRPVVTPARAPSRRWAAVASSTASVSAFSKVLKPLSDAPLAARSNSRCSDVFNLILGRFHRSGASKAALTMSSPRAINSRRRCRS